MDSSRSGKGNIATGKQMSGAGSNSGKSPSIPLAIRFNAGEESVEEIHQNLSAESLVDSPATSVISIDTGKSSLSSSPQLNSDDFSWRKDFLQSSFFQRKRSGSVEGAGGTSPNSSLINSLSTSAGDPNTVGTWKLIKGKVSQAMEDIKSKNTQQACSNSLSIKQQKGEHNMDSDPDTPASDDLSLDISTSVTDFSSHKPQQKDILFDSDLEADTEILEFDTSTQIPLSTPLMRRPFASFRSKTLPISNIKQAVTKTKPSNTVKEENKLFRRRKKDKEDDASNINLGSSLKQKKDIEIESGVEMLEDMVLPQYSNQTLLPKEDNKSDQQSSAQPTETNKLSFKSLTDDSKPLPEFNPESVDPLNKDFSSDLQGSLANSKPEIQRGKILSIELMKLCLSNVYRSKSAIVTVVLLLALLILPICDFFRGMITCLVTISLCATLTEIFKIIIDRSSLVQKLAGIENGRNERIPFKIPDYKNMPICEVPAVEEFKPFKLYAGWMNEINSYDPSNFHISMTRPIFVRLDGSILRIFNTNVRIPKRATWNEPPIHRKNVSFTRHRYFNLKGCRVEMCPRGLARKRYFSRKYPIQLIIKTTDAMKVEDIKPIIPEVLSSSALNLALNSNGNAGNCKDTLPVSHQNSNENNEDHTESHNFDFGAAILHSNLHTLHDNLQPENPMDTVPCGDETRLLLFARCDREKEDWYRRFVAASLGEVNEQEIRNPNIIVRNDEEVYSTFKSAPTAEGTEGPANEPEIATNDPIKTKNKSDADEFEGLIISSNAARNSYDYVKFMSLYQKTCKTDNKTPNARTYEPTKQHRRQKKQDDLWKGVDQSLFLGPSPDVVWANVLIGRVLYGCLNDQDLLEKIQEFLQKKLSAIKLPSFMEDVVIAQTCLGDTPPIIHRVSNPLLDERGVWIDADITYEGLMHMTITTKLNLLRLKRQQQQSQQQESVGPYGSSSDSKETYNSGTAAETLIQTEAPQGLNDTSDEKPNLVTPTDSNIGSYSKNMTSSAIYDSDAESSGASSSDSECAVVGAVNPSLEQTQLTSSYNAPGNSRRLLRIVDRITASNLFQSATEISYIQRAMENMSTTITLKVELKGLIARIVLNLPPPPSDRIWIAFRGPPRLWISAKPAVGDHTFDWSIVTNVIENKLCDEVYKYLVYPNMVDIIAPFLGHSTYRE